MTTYDKNLGKKASISLSINQNYSILSQDKEAEMRLKILRLPLMLGLTYGRPLKCHG